MNHCFCEANKYVDAMARKRFRSSQDLLFFDSPSMNLCILLFYDNIGLYYDMLFYFRPITAVST